jgi:hypothetical protein
MSSIWRGGARLTTPGALRHRGRRSVAVAAAVLATGVLTALLVARDAAPELVVLPVLALIVGVMIARWRVVHARSVRTAHEARARRELTRRLTAGEEPWKVVVAASDDIEDIFGFDECRADLDAQGRVVVFTSPSADDLGPSDRVLFSRFVASLIESVERARAGQPQVHAEP